ncbi:MAG: caspase domain-containing protein, partial [Bacteroidia bacterium]
MKSLLIYSILTLNVLSVKAQVLVGISKPSFFQIPLTSLKISSLSRPVQLSIRKDERFSAISLPVEIKIEKVQAELNRETEVNSSVTITSNETSILEPEGKSPKYYSLIIGINDYIYNDSRLQDLNNAVKDANSLRDVLTRKFSFDVANSILLINPTRQQIIEKLENLALQLTPKDNLLIFYAGHGVWDERIKIGYWLPSDAKSNDKS